MIRQIFVLVVVVAFVSAVPVSRIIGGTKTDISTSPSLVEIQFFGKHHCGGSILTKKCVLTAAHCLRYILMQNKLKVRAGLNYLNTKSDDKMLPATKEQFVHPKFNYVTYDFDVAVLLLDRDITEEIAELVTLADKSPEAGEIVEIRGWGVTAANSTKMSNVLKKVDQVIVDRNKCKNIFEGFNPVTENMFCAIFPDGTEDACQGDSGGPVMLNGQQVGIVSWGIGCAKADWPGGYTDVNAPEIRKYIENIKAEHCL